MQATFAVDDALLDKAREYTGIGDVSAVLREALKALIERESARRLIQLGGSEPDLAAPLRRLPET